MNLFNCFQAMAFYTAMPLGIQYLLAHDYTVWGIFLAAAQLVGYCVISIAISDSTS